MAKPSKNRNHLSLTGKNDDELTSGTFQLRLDCGKRYAHTAASGYHLTMASLQPDSKRPPNCACNAINESRRKSEDKNRVIVIAEHNLEEYILCILDSGKLHQCKLNHSIRPGEQIAFRIVGSTPVQLIGLRK